MFIGHPSVEQGHTAAQGKVRGGTISLSAFREAAGRAAVAQGPPDQHKEARRSQEIPGTRGAVLSPGCSPWQRTWAPGARLAEAVLWDRAVCSTGLSITAVVRG